jgi:DNA-binding transcriptional MerR regulator
MSPERQEPELLSIKEVAQQTGLPASTIRYYDQQFAEYLGVERGPGRRRLFSPQSVERLREVQRMLKDEGLSLRQVRQALSGQAPAPAPAAGDQELAACREEISRLKAQVQELERRVADLKEIQLRTLAVVDGLAR